VGKAKKGLETFRKVIKEIGSVVTGGEKKTSKRSQKDGKNVGRGNSVGEGEKGDHPRPPGSVIRGRRFQTKKKKSGVEGQKGG